MANSGGLQAYRDRVAKEKHDAIMDAAIAGFLAEGYDRTSLEAVAKAAAVSSATVYKHFPTKAALFGAIMSRMWENEPGDEARVPPAGDPRAGLLKIGRDYGTLLLNPQTVDLFRVIIAEAPRFPELGRELYEHGKKPYLDRLHLYLQSEIDTGRLAIDDIPTAGRQFLGMINDTVFWPRLLITDLEVREDEAALVIDGAVDTMLARYAT